MSQNVGRRRPDRSLLNAHSRRRASRPPTRLRPEILGLEDRALLAISAVVTSPTVITSSGAFEISVQVSYTSDATNLNAGSFDLNDVSLSGPNGYTANAIGIGGFVNGATAGVTYSFQAPGGVIDPADDGLYTVIQGANEVSNFGGEFAPAGSIGTFTIDTDPPPTVALSTTATSPTNLASIPVTVTFSEAVSGFDASDLQLTNASAQDFAIVDSSTYTFLLIPTADGPFSVTVGENAAEDSGNKGNLAASAPLSLVSDRTAPAVALSTTATSPTNLASIPVTVTFSEAVSGFDASDLQLTNASVANFTTLDDLTYSFDLVPTNEGFVAVSIAAGTIADPSGNEITAPESLELVYDTTRPTATLSTTATSPTNASTIPVTLTFSEAVVGFSMSNLLLENGTADNLVAIDGTTYTFDLTPASQGEFSVAVAEGAAVDAAGNPSLASVEIKLVLDLDRPTATLSTAATSPTNQTGVPVTVSFNEAVTGFDVMDLLLENATVRDFIGVGSSYSFTLEPTGIGPFSVSVGEDAAADAAGNGSLAATDSVVLVFDPVAPTVSMSAAAGDPAGAAVPVTVTFSEAVSGIDASDLVLEHASVSDFLGDGSNYSFTLTPTGRMPASVLIRAGAASDAAGNASEASTILTLPGLPAPPEPPEPVDPEPIAAPEPLRPFEQFFVGVAPESVSRASIARFLQASRVQPFRAYVGLFETNGQRSAAVRGAYRMILGRDPESPLATQAHWASARSVPDIRILWRAIARSDEFFARGGSTAEGFAGLIYETFLDRPAGDFEIANAVRFMRNSTGQPARTRLINAIFQSPEFTTFWTPRLYQDAVSRA
ncbi:Ig-like domain-containing protein [Tautonia rosea]|uniref:Ig-like domain-containing protein n=1 Tax=Tautonia rosea TaxID=2728037 RepID=UPI0014729C0F|nr:Ig-like domain-containing protein [Tautonia rosea]